MQKLIIALSTGARIEIEGDTPQDIIRQAAFWQSLPTNCKVCNADLVFDYATPKTFKYYKLKCTGSTPHTVNLSEKTADHSMYFDRSKPWEVWRAGATEDDAADRNQAADLPEHPNAPGSPKGELIARVQRLVDSANAGGYALRIDVSNLGAKTGAQLEAIEKHIQKAMTPERRAN